MSETLPADSAPEEVWPAESSPAESSPAESSPAESSPAKSSPAKSWPAEIWPAEIWPAQSVPEEPESLAEESSPAETSPAEGSPGPLPSQPSLWARVRAGLRNPIVTRELLTSLRDPRGFAFLLLAVGLPGALALWAWPSTSTGALRQDEVAAELAALYASSLLALVALFVPATLAPALTLEKEKDTLDLLHTTPLSGDAILLGKLISGVGFFLLLALSTIPLLSLTSLLGGVRFEATLVLYATLVVHAFVYGLTSILISALSRRTLVAVVISYAVVACEAAFLRGAPDLTTTLLWGGLLFLALYPFARLAVRRPYNPVPAPPKVEDSTRAVGLVLRHDAFPDKLILPPPRTDLLPDGVDPIEIKELAAGIHGAGSGFIRALIWIGVFGGLIATVVAVVHHGTGRGFGAGYAVFCFAIAFAATLGPAVGARAFSGERDEGTNEMLVLTVIPRGRLVFSKFKAHLRVVLVLSAINCVPFLAFAAMTGPLRILLLALILVSTSVTAVAVGFWFSLSARSTVGAMFRSFSCLALLWLGPLAARALLGSQSEVLDFVLRLSSPFRAFAINGRGAEFTYEASLAALHVLLWGALATGILVYCARHFDEVMNTAAER